MDLKKRDLRGMQRDAARRQSLDAETTVQIDLGLIGVDEAVQVRQNGLDMERVQQYALAMIEYGGWGEFPPLVVFRNPDTNEVLLAGGFHRRAAVDLAQQGLAEDGKPPIEQVPCEMRTGDRHAAIEFAEDDNLQHGLNLTNRDKRAIYERQITEGHTWARYSNRRIAAELGISEITVRRWRNDMTATNVAVGEPETRIGQDGREYDVSNIQGANQRRASEQRPPADPAPAPRDGSDDDGARPGRAARAEFDAEFDAQMLQAKVVAALGQQGPLSPYQLRTAVGAEYAEYNAAINGLTESGAVVAKKDVNSGLVVLCLATADDVPADQPPPAPAQQQEPVEAEQPVESAGDLTADQQVALRAVHLMDDAANLLRELGDEGETRLREFADAVAEDWGLTE